MTALDNTTSVRQRREVIVNRHMEAELQHDIEATIATFAHPRYELNGVPSDGAEAVRELLQGLMQGFPRAWRGWHRGTWLWLYWYTHRLSSVSRW